MCHAQPLLVAAWRAVWIVAKSGIALVTLACDVRGGTCQIGWDGSKEIKQWSYKGLLPCKTHFSGFFHQ